MDTTVFAYSIYLESNYSFLCGRELKQHHQSQKAKLINALLFRRQHQFYDFALSSVTQELGVVDPPKLNHRAIISVQATNADINEGVVFYLVNCVLKLIYKLYCPKLAGKIFHSVEFLFTLVVIWRVHVTIWRETLSGYTR